MYNYIMLNQVWWTKDGESIPESGRIRSTVDHQIFHILKVKNVREKDFGRYDCNVYSNKTFKQVHESVEVSGNCSSSNNFLIVYSIWNKNNNNNWSNS